MYGLMNEGKEIKIENKVWMNFVLNFHFKVTNESNTSRSSSDNQSISSDECSIEHPRPRRLRSLIEATMEKPVNEKSIEQDNNSTNIKQNSSTDKRPFPFGLW